MRTQQVLILYERESRSRFYSWQAYVNEQLKRLTEQKDVSDVRVVFMNETVATITYFVEIDE